MFSGLKIALVFVVLAVAGGGDKLTGSQRPGSGLQ